MRKIGFVKPEVLVTNITDNRNIAWRFSRENPDEHGDLHDMEYMDFTLADMKTVTLQFVHSSVVIRELLFILRPIYAWARSSRASSANNLVDLDYSEEEKSLLLDKFSKAIDIAENDNRDIGREMYPLAVDIGFTVTMSFRLLMLWIKSIESLSDIYFKYYGVPIIKQMGMTMDEYHKYNYKPDLWKSYVLDEDTFVDGKSEEITGYIGSMFEGQISFLSQLNRQSTSKLLTNLYTLLLEKGEKYLESEMTQGCKLKAHLLSSKIDYMKIAEKRSCTIFDHRHWSPFVVTNFKDKINRGESVLSAMPCDSCHEKCIVPVEEAGSRKGVFANYPCFIANKSRYWLNRYKEKFPGVESTKYMDMIADELDLPSGPNEVDKLALERHGE